MKKTLLLFSLLASQFAHSQSANFPNFINYQAVLRDVNGNALPAGTTGTLNFKLFDSLNASSAAYEEVHNYTTNIAGVVALQIGKGTQVSPNNLNGVNWNRGKVSYEIYLNGSSTPLFPRQAFATVPYAVYALNSGNGLPAGTTGQTLYYDGSKWVPNSTLNNNGTSVGIGITAGGGGNRLHVNSFNASDSSTIYTVKGNANGRDASIRGLTNGNTINNVSNPSLTAIYGGDFYGLNNGTGYGIGVSGVGSSSGTAAGVIGVATGGPTSTLVGVYGSAERSTYSPHNFAAVFNKGKVSIGDTLIFPYTTATVGSVLTLNAQKKGVWTTLNSSSPISIAQGGIVNVNPLVPSTSFTISAAQPVFSNIGIGTITPAAYPNYALNIPAPTFSSVGLANVNGVYPNYTVGVATPTLNFNMTNGNLNLLQGPFSTSVNISPSLALIGNTLNVMNSSIALPGLNLWSRVTNTATNLFNTTDNVGIGTTNPLQKLDVNGYLRIAAGITTADEAWLVYSPAVGLSILRAGGRATSEMRLDQSNNAPITLWTAGSEKMRITQTGEVGIGIANPTEKLSVSGNVLIPGTSEYLYSAPKTKYVNMATSSFVKAGTATGNPVYSTSDIEVYLDGNGASVIGYFSAPLNLPNNATITAMSAYITDPLTGSNDEALIYLRFVPNLSGTPSTIASTGSTGPGTTTGYQQFTTTANHVVDNNNNVYTINMTLGNNTQIRVRNVKVTYQVNKSD
ncbi:MAG: hypothetical protein ACK5ZT_15590 [Sphingobacteriaceae bacterium]